jgi:hypothetical protein
MERCDGEEAMKVKRFYENQCKDCEFWVEVAAVRRKGVCHGGPPTARTGAEIGEWPKTFDDDSCRVWEKKRG